MTTSKSLLTLQTLSVSTIYGGGASYSLISFTSRSEAALLICCNYSLFRSSVAFVSSTSAWKIFTLSLEACKSAESEI
jgi:hypothetical protein